MKISRLVIPTIVLPCTVTIFVPAIILSCPTPTLLSCAQSWRSFANLGSLSIAQSSLIFSSILLLLVGLGLAISSMALFFVEGKGTLAPWDPPRTLVLKGIYRHVRNPMITGLFCILLSEAIFFLSLALFLWFCFFLLANLFWIPLAEEPKLIERFGAPYKEYMKNVARWIPRIRPWEPI